MNVTVFVNEHSITVPAGTTILDAARLSGEEIPTLCDVEGCSPVGSCRLCSVEVAGVEELVSSCTAAVGDAMCITTNNARVMNARRTIVELLIAEHAYSCLSCSRNGTCELQKLASTYGIDSKLQAPVPEPAAAYEILPGFLRSPHKCIVCGRCVRVCGDMQGIGAIDIAGTGADTAVVPSSGRLDGCVSCGTCVVNCPTGALGDSPVADRVIGALRNPDKTVVVQIAPEVNRALCRHYGVASEDEAAGKLSTALRRMGADLVLRGETAIAISSGDLARELGARESGGMPVLTSNCPAWVMYITTYRPDLTGALSRCALPHISLTRRVREYVAKQRRIPPKAVFMISISQCVAAKVAMADSGSGTAGGIDAAVTTRDLVRIVELFGLQPGRLPLSPFDSIPSPQPSPLEGSHPVTGMESLVPRALRIMASETGGTADVQPLAGDGAGPTLPREETRFQAVKVFTLAAAAEALKRVESGALNVDLIEVAACPGGCERGSGRLYGDDTGVGETTLTSHSGPDHARLRVADNRSHVGALPERDAVQSSMRREKC